MFEMEVERRVPESSALWTMLAANPGDVSLQLADDRQNASIKVHKAWLSIASSVLQQAFQTMSPEESLEVMASNENACT